MTVLGALSSAWKSPHPRYLSLMLPSFARWLFDLRNFLTATFNVSAREAVMNTYLDSRLR